MWSVGQRVPGTTVILLSFFPVSTVCSFYISFITEPSFKCRYLEKKVGEEEVQSGDHSVVWRVLGEHVSEMAILGL